MKSIVIIGYGQLGKALCQRHLAAGDTVFSVSRTHYNALSNRHVPISIDLDALTSPLSVPVTIDGLYYLAPPSDIDLADHRLANLLTLQAQTTIRHLIYISTTGVYGDGHQELITEQTPVNPKADRSKRRLHAEQQLKQYANSHTTAVTILRCAAIYSATTVNYQKIKSNTRPVIKASQAPFTNRIHLHDLTEVCWQAMRHMPQQTEVYNVSDGQPSTTTEHAWLLSDLAGLPRSPEIDINDASQYYSPAYMSYLQESKRLDITKLKQQLQPNFKFENCREGIIDCLNQSAKSVSI